MKLFHPPPLTPRRVWLALTVAVLADLLQIPTTTLPVVPEGIDVVTMIVVAWLLGFHWLLLPTFVVEFFPVVDMLPTWTACVGGVIALRKGVQPKSRVLPPPAIGPGQPDEPPVPKG